MQKIVPHLWYDKAAVEAAKFYVNVFGGDSAVEYVSELHGTPSGDTDIVSFKLWGYRFMSISAGPFFKPNPSISFMMNFDPSQMENAREKIDEIWEKLSDGGKILMPLDKYPFSERYGWVEDKYGFSWQLIFTNPEGDERPLVIPAFLFVTDECVAAEEAAKFYASIFKNAKAGDVMRYPAGMEPNKQGSVMFTEIKLEGQWFAAMDGSSSMHKFKFNEAISLLINCENQEEIDYYWEKLSAVPEAEQCGWLKDKFGVSWQVSPTALDAMMRSEDKNAVDRVTQAFLKMKKFDIAELERAAKGE